MENNQDSTVNEDHAAQPKAAVTNFLGLSDDEIANLSDSDLQAMLADSQPEEAEQVEDEQEVEPEDVADEVAVEDTEEAEPEDTTGTEAADTTVAKVETTTTEAPTTVEQPETVESTPELHKEVYDRLFKQPIRANNKDLQLNNVDDVIKLVQMGANYNLKMAGIKEQLPFIKILEKNDLLNERDLSYLIDLKLGKSEAIARLLKENDIDPYEFDLSQSEGYIPEGRGVSHQEIELEDIISEISKLPKFLDTMDVVQKTWDDESRELIRKEPNRLKIISDHVESGLFQKVWDEVERNLAYGNIPSGVTAIQAYEYYGNEMNKLGLLNEFSAGPQATSVKATTEDDGQEAIKQAKEKALKAKKRAAVASVSKVAPNTGKPKSISPLAMSDEEFAKFGDPSLM